MDIPSELLVRVSLGDEEAYSELFRLSWDQAVRTVWLMLRNKHDAEEAAQEAFLKLYVHRRDIQEVSSFHNWFYRILVNTALDRARKRKKTVNIEHVTIVGPEREYRDIERKIVINDAMTKLSYEERMAIVLIYFNGLNEREASSAMGWRLGKLKYRVNQARRKMARDINRDGSVSLYDVKEGTQRG